MDHVVARENIKHFTSRLKSELHPRVRSYMQKLLVREEDKLGADLEFLAEVDQTIIGFDALKSVKEPHERVVRESELKQS